MNILLNGVMVVTGLGLAAAIIPIKIAIPFLILHTPFLSQVLSRAGCTGPICTVM